jgi:myo-inositol-1(or 4)-monophosphatase
VSEFDTRLACAIDLAIEAGRLAQSMRHNLGPVDAKSPIDFCTAADLAVERLIRDRVTSRFGDSMIGEEDGGAPSEKVWLVDPIDGTTNYILGTKRWCVSLAFVSAGAIELGVIYAPEEDRLFVARRNGGATMNGRPMRVSGLRHGAMPVVEVGWSARRPLAAYCDVLLRLGAEGAEFRRMGSGALALADVAAGLNDGYLELHINAWDALAAILLVHEAGGRTNDFLAGRGLTEGNPLWAATPEIAGLLETILAAQAVTEGV